MDNRTAQTIQEIKRIRETEKPDNRTKEHEQRKNNERSLIKLFKRRNKIHKKNTRHTTEEATKFLLKISLPVKHLLFENLIGDSTP